MNRPFRGQAFPLGEDLFNHNIEIFRAAIRLTGMQTLLQSPQIPHWITQAVDVVDAETCHHPFTREAKNHGMLGLERDRILDTNSDKFADREKAPVVDFLVGRTPKREFVRLFGQKLIHQQESRWCASFSIKQPNISIDESPYLRGTGVKSPEALLDRLPMLATLASGFQRRAGRTWDLGNRGQDSLKLLQFRRLRAQRALQAIQTIAQDSGIRSHGDGESEIEVVQEEARLRVGQEDFAPFQNLCIGFAQNREQDPILQRAARRMPI